MKTVIFVLFLILVLGALAWQLTSQPTASKASVTPATEDPPSIVTAEGRVAAYPGALITLSSELPGTITQLAVDENDVVHKGDVIALLRCDEQQAQLAEARAHMAEAAADMRFYQLEVNRLAELVAHSAGSKEELDRNVAAFQAAQARRDEAGATADRISTVLDKMRIVAPIDGTIIRRLAQPGETITASQPLVTIADLSRTRIEAEVDEFDAGRIAQNAPVTLTAEGYPDRVWHGHVEQIPQSVVDRQTRPEDPGKPSDTRILLVKIHPDEATPFKLRQRVEVSISAARS